MVTFVVEEVQHLPDKEFNPLTKHEKEGNTKYWKLNKECQMLSKKLTYKYFQLNHNVLD